ncbi:MAG: DUF6538 domain-containing protein [Pseudomonadota bacterium]
MSRRAAPPRGSHWEWRGQTARYRRRVPTRYAALDPRGVIKVSLETKDPAVATDKALRLDRELDAYWDALEAGRRGDAEARLAAVARIAAERGFPYRPVEAVAELPLQQLVERLERLAAAGHLTGDAASRPFLEAELGLAPRPRRRLADLVERYEKLTPERLLGKSADQIRRMRNPKLKALNNLIQVIGDKAQEDVDDTDALAFREWLGTRIAAGEIGANSANKDITHLSTLWDTIEAAERRGLSNPWRQMKFREIRASRPPLPADFIREHWLSDRGRARLEALNVEARAILFGLINTGLRPSELAGCAPGEIIVDHELPHVVIQPNESRDIKTHSSRRIVPLVGLSLEAVRPYASSGFPRYAGKDRFSATANKFLVEAALLPSPAHTIYGLRHDFEDRLLDAECPDRIRKDLLGHSIKDRPRYGAGATLRKLTQWCEKVQVA